MNKFTNYKLYLMILLALLYILTFKFIINPQVLLPVLIILTFITIGLMGAITAKIKFKEVVNVFRVAVKTKQVYRELVAYLIKVIILFVVVIGLYYTYDYTLSAMKLVLNANYNDIYSDSVGFSSSISLITMYFFQVLIIFLSVLVINYTIIRTASKLFYAVSKFKQISGFPIHYTTFLFFNILISASIFLLVYVNSNFDSAHVFHEQTINIIELVCGLGLFTTLFCMYYIIIMRRGYTDLRNYKYLLVIAFIILSIIPFIYTSNTSPVNSLIKYDDASKYASELYQSSEDNDTLKTSNLMYSIFQEEMQADVATQLDLLELNNEQKINPIYTYILNNFSVKPEYLYLSAEDDNVYYLETNDSKMLLSSMISSEHTTVYELSYMSNIAKYLVSNHEPAKWYEQTSLSACVFDMGGSCDDDISLPITSVEVYNIEDESYSKQYVASNEVQMQAIIEQFAVFDVYFNGINAQQESLKYFPNQNAALNEISQNQYIYIHQSNIVNGYPYSEEQFESDLQIEAGGYDYLMDNIYTDEETINYEFLVNNYDEYYDLFRMIEISVEDQ